MNLLLFVVVVTFSSLLYLLDSTFKWYHIVFVFLCLAYFMWHKTLQVHPCYCKCETFTLFHGWVVFIVYVYRIFFIHLPKPTHIYYLSIRWSEIWQRSHWAESRCQQGCIAFWSLCESLCFLSLPSPASWHWPHSLVCVPLPSSSKPATASWLFLTLYHFNLLCLPSSLLRTLCFHWPT